MRHAIADYDSAIDDLVTLASSAAQPISDVHIEQAKHSLAARIVDDESTDRRWLWFWVAGAALGLASIIGGFAAGSWSGDLGWVSASVILAGLGAVLAAAYTYGGSAGSPGGLERFCSGCRSLCSSSH